MAVQMQTVSARVPSEDLQWLAALELPGAITPSDKLRALIAQMRKQHEGTLDYSACLAWLRELLAPFVTEIREIEHRQRIHSEAVSAVVEWVPQIMATLLSERCRGKDAVAWVRDVEDMLVHGSFRLWMAVMRLGILRGAECYDPEVVESHLPPVIQLAQLFAANQETAKEKQS